METHVARMETHVAKDEYGLILRKCFECNEFEPVMEIGRFEFICLNWGKLIDPNRREVVVTQHDYS